LPHEIYDQDGSFKERRAGTGPFLLDQPASQSGTRLVWKKNPDYWEQGRPHLDEVYQLVLPDEATAHAAVIARQLDMITERLSLQSVEEIRKANSSVVVGE